MRPVFTAAFAAAIAVFGATAVLAQTPLTGTNGPVGGSPPTAVPPAASSPAGTGSGTGSGTEQTAPASRPVHHRATLEQRFEAANTTHDGHLTQEQARAKMPAVARDFAAIDTDHKGYVTLDEIRAHARTARAARRAAKAGQHS